MLGDNPLLWLLPVSPPSGDGLSFKTSTDLEKERQEALTKSYGTMASPGSERSEQYSQTRFLGRALKFGVLCGDFLCNAFA